MWPRLAKGPQGDSLAHIPTEVYVEALTGKAPGSNGKIECPFHPDWSPSFHVYPGDGGWFCYQCERGGDVFTLAADLWELDTRVDFPVIVKHLRRFFRV